MCQRVGPFDHRAEAAKEQHDKARLCHLAEKAEQLLDTLHQRGVTDNRLKKDYAHRYGKTFGNHGEHIRQIILAVPADIRTAGKKGKSDRRIAHIDVDLQESAYYGQQQHNAGNYGRNREYQCVDGDILPPPMLA